MLAVRSVEGVEDATSEIGTVACVVQSILALGWRFVRGCGERSVGGGADGGSGLAIGSSGRRVLGGEMKDDRRLYAERNVPSELVRVPGSELIVR